MLRAVVTVVMRKQRQILDRQPGVLPEIRTDTRNITFTMAPPGTAAGEQLVIRCDANGDVWLSIRGTMQPRVPGPG
jgi:hypothetical protein